MTLVLSVGFVLWTGSNPVLAEASCSNWATNKFFARVTAEEVHHCLRMGADSNASDPNGRSPLHIAAISSENPDVVQTLLNAGADLNARMEAGSTPLHLVAKSCKGPDVVNVLLDAGANAVAKDVSGRVPWDYAEENPDLKATEAYWRLNDARFR